MKRLCDVRLTRSSLSLHTWLLADPCGVRRAALHTGVAQWHHRDDIRATRRFHCRCNLHKYWACPLRSPRLRTRHPGAVVEMFVQQLLLLLSVIGTTFALPTEKRASPTIQLDHGTFVGTSDGVINKFLGIPFGKAP